MLGGRPGLLISGMPEELLGSKPEEKPELLPDVRPEGIARKLPEFLPPEGPEPKVEFSMLMDMLESTLKEQEHLVRTGFNAFNTSVTIVKKVGGSFN